MALDRSQEPPHKAGDATKRGASDASTDRASPLSSESPAQRLRRHGRRARLYTGAVAFVGLLTIFIVLITANTRPVKLNWAIGSTHASLVWIILTAAVAGWLLGITTALVFHHRTRRLR
jgi:uncharacterized integral membrane protein